MKAVMLVVFVLLLSTMTLAQIYYYKPYHGYYTKPLYTYPSQYYTYAYPYNDFNRYAESYYYPASLFQFNKQLCGSLDGVFYPCFSGTCVIQKGTVGVCSVTI